MEKINSLWRTIVYTIMLYMSWAWKWVRPETGFVAAKVLKPGRSKWKISLANKMRRFVGLAWQMIWKVGREDPRWVTHSVKVGLALTLVSLLCLLEPLFKSFGENTIWAVMTVVVVLEFTVGATLYKGLNRGIGTLLAGLLAFFIEYVAAECGKIFRAVFIGTAVFVTGTGSTYLRFIPFVKKNYDYGVLIFLLTFNLVTVSSYRVNNITKMAQERFYTIALGCGICLLTTLVIFPNWSGEDLHKSTLIKLEGLAKSIEACVNGYFNNAEIEVTQDEALDDSIYNGYKVALDSKSSDETMALYSSWEPRHTIHCYKFPWKQYVELGADLRHFGYAVVALHGCLQTEIQAPRYVRALFKDPCIRVAREVSKVLMELANSIRNHRHCAIEILSGHLHEALYDLNTAIKSQPKLFLGSNHNHNHGFSSRRRAALLASTTFKHERRASERSHEIDPKVLRTLSRNAITSLDFSDALPFAAFASLLLETVARLDNIIMGVEDLGKIACFKDFKPSEEISLSCGE